MVILQCLVFDWILVNVFKVDVEHYWPLNADVTVYGSFTVTSDGRVGVKGGGELERPSKYQHRARTHHPCASVKESTTTEQMLEFGLRTIWAI